MCVCKAYHNPQLHENVVLCAPTPWLTLLLARHSGYSFVLTFDLPRQYKDFNQMNDNLNDFSFSNQTIMNKNIDSIINILSG